MEGGDDDNDGKSSMAPMMTPRSVTPAGNAAPQTAAPQTAASNAERIQSSIGTTYTLSVGISDMWG